MQNTKKNSEIEGKEFILEINNLNVWIDNDIQLLKNINIKIPEYSIVAIIGSSGSGKSSILKTINKTYQEGKYSYEGTIKYKGINILDKNIPEEYVRTQIGTVLQKPIMFPMSIRENILFALKSHGIIDPNKLEIILEKTLRESHLWEEVKDRLNSNPEDTLSIGQQQRLCIARAIALQPKVLLMDEPTSALDLKASKKIEELIKNIATKQLSTIILISHSLSQVKRISDYTIFVKEGKIIEQGKTKNIFNKPEKKETKEFISGSY